MRNISFALTKQQFIDGMKDVTRRLGWAFLKGGEHLMGCEKCQGIRAGELVRLGEIVVLDARREPLNAITQEDVVREGFPNLAPAGFVEMFCDHSKCEPQTTITRIEFRRI